MTTRPPRRLLLLALPALAAAAPLAAAPAAGAATTTATPTITSVTPMQAGIGDTLTVRGRNFRAGRLKNTVVFRRDGAKAVFVKAGDATTTRLRIRVPDKLRTYMATKDGVPVGTRFRLRIIAKRFGKSYTTTKLSPLIRVAATTAPAPDATGDVGPGTSLVGGPVALGGGTAPPPDPDCDGDGNPNSSDPDDDNDGLSDVQESVLKTDPCNADTDGDGMEDGWEFQSAVDLNRPGCNTPTYPTPCLPLPYPGKRPYPNPLDASDGGNDYDGDWLPAFEEHRAWKRKVGHNLANMWYSDGLKASQDSPATTGCVGLVPPAPIAPGYSLDRNGDGCLNDSERDEDDDYLTNAEELSAQLHDRLFWQKTFKETAYRYVYSGTDWLDRDSDGDTLPDGLDDQDFDDFLNLEELWRGSQSVDKEGVSTGVTTGRWVDPFNPCLPWTGSRTCPDGLPLSGAIWAPHVPPDAEQPLYPRWPLWSDTAPPERGPNPLAPILLPPPA
jgi:hypothetical protein